MKSVIQDKKECYVCGTTIGVEAHHMLHGIANRKKAEQYGYKVFLCNRHHTGSKEAVHNNPSFDLVLKQMAQMHFEIHHSRGNWIKEFGKSYL